MPLQQALELVGQGLFQADDLERGGAISLVGVGVDELALLDRQVEAAEFGDVHAQRDGHRAGLAVEVLEVQHELVQGPGAVDAVLPRLGVPVEVKLDAGARPDHPTGAIQCVQQLDGMQPGWAAPDRLAGDNAEPYLYLVYP